ncbi:Spc97/Spc98 family protein [Gigaspora margarita]|uniref:Spindle pole body component n=1 Tax=Gigaspora margarita TaxID=4874 RepID=A0A8H4A242_GIGMA|nr:Spc97/Spc98 family protein [Gigaspora margarita]
MEEFSIWERISNDNTKQVQMLSWETNGKTNLQQNNISPYLSESNLSTYEAVYHEHFHHQFSYDNLGFIVSHEVIIQDILHLVTGTSSNSFVYDPIHMRFNPKVQNIRIHGCSAKSINIMMGRFLNMGSHIRRLDVVSERCMKAVPVYGLTGAAFGRSLSSFIMYIQKSIVSIAESSGEQENMIHLYHAMDDISLVIERIAAFCYCDVSDSRISELSPNQKEQRDNEGFYLPFGSKILSEIYIAAETIDLTRSPFLRAVFLAFLDQSSRPFFEMLSSWLGTLSSSCSFLSINEHYEYIYPNEFFISNFKVDAISVKDDGDEFWQGGMEVDIECFLPTFISPALARDILEAGKTLRLLRDCRPDHPLCNSGAVLSNMIDRPWNLDMKFLFIQGDIDEMHDQLNDYLRNMTIAIITQDEQRSSEIAYIRDFYQCKMTERKQKNTNLKLVENITQFITLDSSAEDPTIMLIERFLQAQSSTSLYAHKEYILPLGAVIDLVLKHTLICHCRLIDASILSIFFHDLDLRAHLNVLREFMLLSNGTFVSGLTDALFSDNVDYGEDFTANSNYGSKFGMGLRLNSRKTWPPVAAEWVTALKAVIMETILLEKNNTENDGSQAAVGAWSRVNDLDNLLMFGVRIDMDHCNDPNALEALDSFCLNYKPPYPINVIITPSSLDKYNRLFVFLLRVLRMGIVSRHIYRLLHDRYLIDDKDTAEDKNLAQKFRFEAQQFISALHGYAFDVAISSTWTHFMKRLNKIAKEAKFGVSREHSRNASNASSADNQSFSSESIDDFNDNDNYDDEYLSEGVKNLESLRAYHNHILERMLSQCLLIKEQESITRALNRIQAIILEFSKQLLIHRFRTFDTNMRHEFWRNIKYLYDQFRSEIRSLIKTLVVLDEKVGGRMSMGMKQTGNYDKKVDNKFLQELLLRIDFNGHYTKSL